MFKEIAKTLRGFTFLKRDGKMRNAGNAVSTGRLRMDPIVRMNYCIWMVDQRLRPLHFCVCTFMTQTLQIASLFLHLWRDATKRFCPKREEKKNAIHSF